MKTNVYIEEGVDCEGVKTGRLSYEDDHTRRHCLVRSCADAFVIYKYEGIRGIFTAYRDDNKPLPKALWIPGGMWSRGILSPELAAVANLKRETGLDMTDMDVLAHDSFLWKDSPYDDEVRFKGFRERRKERNLGDGLHELGFAVFGRASGNLALKTMGQPIVMITKENYDRVMAEHVNNSVYGQSAHYFKTNVAKALERM